MDYEKAYKELVKNFACVLKLKSVKESGTIPVDDVRKLIPELIESEDEMIRKAILHLVKSQKQQHFGIATYDGINWLDMISWLEKQGKQKTIDDTEMNSLAYLTELGYTCIPPKK